MEQAESVATIERTAQLLGINVSRERAAFEKYSAEKAESFWHVWLGRAVAGACRLI